MKKASIAIFVVLVAVCGFGMFAMRSLVGAAAPKPTAFGEVTRADLAMTLVETGSIDANKTVDVKSRVSGRLARLLVKEGDVVAAGQLIAVIDPKETALKVDQDRAVLSGAKSGATRSDFELSQRVRSNQAALGQAQVRVRQFQDEMNVQPALTKAAIEAAQTALNASLKDRDLLVSTTQPNERTNSESTVGQAGATFAAAESDYNRQQSLLEKGYVSAKDVEAARQQFEVARLTVQSAKQSNARLDKQFSLEIARADEVVAQSRAALRTAEANAVQDTVKRQDYLAALRDLDKAKAALEDTQIFSKQRDQSYATVRQYASVLSDSERLLGETDIRAPMSGIVTKKLAEEGDLITGLSDFTQGTPIVRVEDRSGMVVKLDVNEIDVAQMTTGMKAKIEVDALAKRAFSGTVTKIAPSSTASSTTSTIPTADAVVKYEVEIRFDNSDASLLSGMSAKCTLDVWRRADALQVPLEYVGHDGKASYVMLAPAKKGAKPTSETIETGKETGSAVEVLSGAKEGQKLVKPPFGGPPRKGAIQMGGD